MRMPVDRRGPCKVKETAKTQNLDLNKNRHHCHVLTTILPTAKPIHIHHSPLSLSHSHSSLSFIRVVSIHYCENHLKIRGYRPEKTWYSLPPLRHRHYIPRFTTSFPFPLSVLYFRLSAIRAVHYAERAQRRFSPTPRAWELTPRSESSLHSSLARLAPRSFGSSPPITSVDGPFMLVFCLLCRRASCSVFCSLFRSPIVVRRRLAGVFGFDFSRLM